MIECLNAVSIFEVGVGVNAVIAVVGDTVSSTQRKFLKQLQESIRSVNPDIREEYLHGRQFETLAYAGFPNIRRIVAFGYFVRFYALALVAISIGTLIQAAVFTECSITQERLYLYTMTAFVFGPLLYWSYSRFLLHFSSHRYFEEAMQKGAIFLEDLVGRSQQLDDQIEEIMSKSKHFVS